MVYAHHGQDADRRSEGWKAPVVFLKKFFICYKTHKFKESSELCKAAKHDESQYLPGRRGLESAWS